MPNRGGCCYFFLPLTTDAKLPRSCGGGLLASLQVLTAVGWRNVSSKRPQGKRFTTTDLLLRGTEICQLIQLPFSTDFPSFFPTLLGFCFCFINSINIYISVYSTLYSHFTIRIVGSCLIPGVSMIIDRLFPGLENASNEFYLTPQNV